MLQINALTSCRSTSNGSGMKISTESFLQLSQHVLHSAQGGMTGWFVCSAVHLPSEHKCQLCWSGWKSSWCYLSQQSQQKASRSGIQCQASSHSMDTCQKAQPRTHLRHSME